MRGQEHDLNLIAALVEGRLDERERARLMEHLADCGECRTVFAQLGRAANDGSLSGTGEDAARRNADAPPPSRRHWTSSKVWFPIAASLAIAAVAIRLVVGPPETGGSSSPASGASTQTEKPISGDEELLLKRSGGRQVAGKVFRMTESACARPRAGPVCGTGRSCPRRAFGNRISVLAVRSKILER